MTVHIDEPRRDDTSTAIDPPDAFGIGEVANCGDAVSSDSDRRSLRRSARSIEDSGVLKDTIEAHGQTMTPFVSSLQRSDFGDP